MTENILKQVKEKFSSNAYREAARLKCIRPTSELFILAGRRLSPEEIAEKFYAVERFSQDDELSAVGKLIDNELFETLNGEERERYILNASALYRELKKEVLRQKNFGLKIS